MKLDAAGRKTLALVAGVHVLLALFALDPSPYLGGDNAVYHTLARSLLEHGTYRDLYLPGTPRHVQYPPVFPLLLAGLMALGIRSWLGLKLLVVALSGVAVALSHLWLRRTLPRSVAWGATLVLVVSPGVLYWSRWLLSDVPFWALTMLALVAYQAGGGTDRRWTAVGITATVLALFTRTAGLPLVIAAAFWLASRNRRALLVLLGVVAVLGTAWWAWGSSESSGYLPSLWIRDPYRPELGRIGLADIPGRLADNVRAFTLLSLPLLLSGSASTAARILATLVLMLGIWAWVRRCRAPSVAEILLPLYLGLLLLWPTAWADDRFLLPVLPLLLGYAGLTVHMLATRLHPRARAASVAAIPLLLVGIGVPVLASNLAAGVTCTRLHLLGQRHACQPPHWRDFFLLAEASRSRLPPDAVVISRKPSLFYALSGRQSVVFPFSADAGELFRLARDKRASFLLVNDNSGTTGEYLLPAMAAHPERFCVRQELVLPGAAMVQILDPSPPSGDQRPAAGSDLSLRWCSTAAPTAPTTPPRSSRRLDEPRL